MSLYNEQLQHLYSVNLHHGVKLGLATIERLCKAFNNPEKQFKSIHVAGTNGKGSVSTKIASALKLYDKRVGLFTSPHISTFRERIRINDEMISEVAVTKLLQEIFAVIKSQDIPATFFEITTLLAFLYFKEQNVEIAVLETGLGGRLDSTNVIHPLFSVITSIALDHTDILGNSIEEIAMEKAGIIKENSAVVIGPNVPFTIIHDIAKTKNSPCIQVKGEFEDYNSENSAIARCCLEKLKVPEKHIANGIQALPSCRMEHIHLNTPAEVSKPLAIILDVAHNPDGLERLLAAVKLQYPKQPLRFICGFSKNKDIPTCARIIALNGNTIHCISANNDRALSTEELFQNFVKVGVAKERLIIKSSLQENLAFAVKEAAFHKEVLVICGSFFIMAEIRKHLGILEPQDFLDLNEHFQANSK